ncbi:MAG: Na+/H+ antiporter NhaA, partial [Pirellulaceae bacterium]
MANDSLGKQPRAVRFLFENSIFLIAGAVVALVWANMHHESYEHLVTFNLARLFTEHVGGHGFTVHNLINDVMMALLFALAGKEVWESFLPGGALSSVKKAATPLLATLGGIVGPAVVYLAIVQSTGQWADLADGWAIPCATDIAFSYLVARLIFGGGHPAIAFLLLLAIADDAAGLIILAIFYPKDPIQIQWLLLTVAAIAIGFGFRKMKLQSFWWYLLIPGTLSWISFYMSNVHPALGLVPIIPCMPHAHTDLGIFARAELNRDDTLNAFEHWWKNP